MKFFKLNKTTVLFLYKNGYYEVGKLPKEDDRTITVLNRTIIKNTNDAFINDAGGKLYFVNGMDCKTSKPDDMKEDEQKGDYKTMLPYEETKTESDMDREATYAVMRTNLLKGLAQMQNLGSMISILLIVAGAGVGYVLGSEWGGDTYNQQEYNENYPTETPRNETIIINMLRVDLLCQMQVQLREVKH